MPTTTLGTIFFPFHTDEARQAFAVVCAQFVREGVTFTATSVTETTMCLTLTGGF